MTLKSTCLLKLSLFIAALFAPTSYSLMAQNDTSATRTIKAKPSDKSAWGNTYALIIGISKYKSIDQLNYADDDAEAFRDLLVNTKIVASVNDVSLLKDEDATKAQINSELRKISSRVKPDNNDRVIIYFAGHGDNDLETEQGYLLAYACNDTVAYYDNDAIFIPQLESIVNGISKKAKVILITDACRSGNLAGKMKGALQTLKAINEGFVNTIKILSCKPDQLSQEKSFPGGGHGVFTYYLLEALSGLSVGDAATHITVTDLEDYLPKKVSDETGQEQRPIFVYDKNEVIAKVDKEMRLAAIENKKNGKGILIAKRDIRNTKINMSVDDSVYFKKFYEHLRAGRLRSPSGQNAYETYKVARKNVKNEDLINAMKFDLAAKLEDAVQPVLSRFIRAEFQDYPENIFKEADSMLRIVQEELMDSTDFRFNEIKAKRIFFIASITKSPWGLELLQLADSLMPNSTFINFELGRHYSEVRKSADTALIYYNKAIRLSPRWSYPRFMIGNIHYRSEKFAMARTFYHQAIDLQPKFAYALFNLGMAFKKEKQKDSADYYYNKALLLDKNFEHLWAGIRETDDDEEIVSLGKTVRNKTVADESMFAGLLPPGLKQPVKSASTEAKDGYDFYSKAYYFKLDGLTDSALYWYQQAADMFEKAYTNKTMPLSYYYTWGYTHQSLENYQKAKEIYQLGLKNDTTDFDLYTFGIAWIEDKEDHIEEALKWYRTSVTYNPRYHQAFNNIGWAYARLKNTDSAIYYYRKALQFKPDFTTSLSNIANMFFDRYEDDSAIYYYKKLNQYLEVPDHFAYNRIGVSYDYLGQYDSAVLYFEKAIRLDDTQPVFFKNIGNAFYNLKQYAMAVQYYERANSMLADSIDVYFNLGLSYAYLAHYKKAENVFKKALDKEASISNLYLYYYNLGWTMDKQKNLDEALFWYLQAIKENPKYLNALNNIGYTYDRMSKTDSAIYWYRQTIRVNPTYTRSLNNLASLYNDLYKYDSALYYYKILYSLAPTDASVPYEIAQLYYYYGMNDSAALYYERAIDLNSDRADYRSKAGDAFYNLRNYQKAIYYYTEALNLDSTLYLTMNMLGLSYTYSFRYNEAIALYEQALVKDKLYKSTYEYNLACIYSLTKNSDKALYYFEQSLISGYKDLAHIAEDTDLDNIRRLPAFRSIIEKYFEKKEIEKISGLFGK